MGNELSTAPPDPKTTLERRAGAFVSEDSSRMQRIIDIYKNGQERSFANEFLTFSDLFSYEHVDEWMRKTEHCTTGEGLHFPERAQTNIPFALRRLEDVARALDAAKTQMDIQAGVHKILQAQEDPNPDRLELVQKEYPAEVKRVLNLYREEVLLTSHFMKLLRNRVRPVFYHPKNPDHKTRGRQEYHAVLALLQGLVGDPENEPGSFFPQLAYKLSIHQGRELHSLLPESRDARIALLVDQADYKLVNAINDALQFEDKERLEALNAIDIKGCGPLYSQNAHNILTYTKARILGRPIASCMRAFLGAVKYAMHLGDKFTEGPLNSLDDLLEPNGGGTSEEVKRYQFFRAETGVMLEGSGLELIDKFFAETADIPNPYVRAMVFDDLLNQIKDLPNHTMRRYTFLGGKLEAYVEAGETKRVKQTVTQISNLMRIYRAMNPHTRQWEDFFNDTLNVPNSISKEIYERTAPIEIPLPEDDKMKVISS
ncbi:MAG: hypothetical protein ACE5FT_00185 [Candidatus Nanoarchaeia archaeon]